MDAYWIVIYRDGTTFMEVDDQGRVSSWAAAPHENVEELQFVNAAMRPFLRVLVPEGAEPVLFRRHRLELDPQAVEPLHDVIPCVGWRKGREAKYCFAVDGRIIETNDLQAV